MERKKRLRLIQITMLILGILIIFFTYLGKNEKQENKIITKETQEKIKEQMQLQNQQGDVFYNIEYSGLDLAGNRYILKSKEAISDKNNPEIVYMKFVEAVFYFKDNTVLNVWSEKGIYNNKTLNMNFENNVKANYEGSELFAQKAEYSNLKSFLTISEDVKINDIRGAIVADKLLFDIKKQTLNIASFNDGKVNANVNLK
ncbi:MAG: LPS export ABC transporter periplasmic protein LptC [Pseudomonadota bacterium]|nr:LPS export ABC transporter periplasmic protein LptC [Pseudomonadota bacterium]